MSRPYMQPLFGPRFHVLWLGLGCLTPLSTVFQLCHGGVDVRSVNIYGNIFKIAKNTHHTICKCLILFDKNLLDHIWIRN